jgi:endonuclease/exonuclease/phosphatase family metal-dependent hydrolase
VVVASVNANKRLGTPKPSSLCQAWLDRHAVTLVLVQEGWRGARDTRAILPGMTFVAGDAELAIWIRPGHELPRTDRPARWCQVAHLGDVVIHSVHLDPKASAARVQQLETLAAELPADARNVVVGDFNLAPRPSDGRYGDTASPFTSARERSTFAKLVHEHDLVDATARDEPVFTFTRLIRGVPSSFRCDLALIPASLSPAIVKVSSETRTGPTAFTDHSGLVVELDENLRGRRG